MRLLILCGALLLAGCASTAGPDALRRDVAQLAAWVAKGPVPARDGLVEPGRRAARRDRGAGRGATFD